MTDCRNCRRDTDLFLCTLCTKELHVLLADLPWLLDQLEVTVTRQDRLNLGVVGKSGNASPSPVNIGAMELSRNLANQLGTMVRGLCENTGQPVPEAPTNTALASWLYAHVPAIACSADAGHIMREIRGGTEGVLRAINRNLRMYCGPCVVIRAHNRRGEAIECGHDIYAPRDSDEQVQCPRCKTWLDPREQLLTTVARRDLLPESHLLDTLATLGQPVSRARFYAWVKAGRLRPRGYVHHGRVVPHRVNRGDPRVFSLKQAQQLRRHELAS